MSTETEKPAPETAAAEAAAPDAAGGDQELKDKIITVLKSCFDPEIPVNIYELGLIYDVGVKPDGNVQIKMTLTSPMCPVAETLPPEVEMKVKKLPEVNKATVEVVWEPTWEPSMMSEAAKLQLNMMQEPPPPLSTSLDLPRIRRLFPALADRVYLDAASLGLVSTVTADAVGKMVELAAHPPVGDTGAQHVRLAKLRAAARPAVARLLATDADSIALVENTTQGLSLAVAAIPASSGDNVVLVRSDYIQTAVPWARRQRQDGLELRFVAAGADGLSLDAFAAQIDERTRAVCVSSVQWTSGQRLDLAGLRGLTEPRGIWLVVDGAQHVGAMRFDLRQTPVDFLACSGHKWLNSPFGCGFLYVGPRAAQELEAPLAGFLGANPPRGGWGAYFSDPEATAMDSLSFPANARPWESGGTPNFPGAVALHSSIEQILAIGPDAIEAHIRTLAGRLRESLIDLGVSVVAPTNPDRSTGIVAFHLGSGTADEQAAAAALQERGVQLSVRYGGGIGGLRAAVHYFNDETDTARLVEEVGRLL